MRILSHNSDSSGGAVGSGLHGKSLLILVHDVVSAFELRNSASKVEPFFFNSAVARAAKRQNLASELGDFGLETRVLLLESLDFVLVLVDVGSKTVVFILKSK